MLALRQRSAVPLLNSPITRAVVTQYPGKDMTALDIKKNHARLHWHAERVVGLTMFPLFPLSLMVGGPVMDFSVVTCVTLHSYWGLEGVIMDYSFERRYGPVLQPVAMNACKVLCAIAYAGFLYFNYTDVGFVEAIKYLWSV